MSYIVEKLAAQFDDSTAMEARAEIEKMRDALKKICDAEIMSTWEMKAIAREALASTEVFTDKVAMRLQAEIERLRKALREINRCTGLLIHQNTGRWSMGVERDRRTYDVLSGNQLLARAALKDTSS